MKEVYLIVGVPASGKSYVCNRLRTQFEYVPHDGYIHLKNPSAYLSAVLKTAETATKPLLIEAPFSMKIMDSLMTDGYTVHPVFILERETILRARYQERGRMEEHIIQGHLTRQDTFRKRAKEYNAFGGDSSEVLTHLKSK